MTVFELTNGARRKLIVVARDTYDAEHLALRLNFIRPSSNALKVKPWRPKMYPEGCEADQKLKRILKYNFRGVLVKEVYFPSMRWIIANEHNDRLCSEWVPIE